MKQIRIKTSQVLLWVFTVIRIIIGWHFLYEGISKIIAEELEFSSISCRIEMDFRTAFTAWQTAGGFGIVFPEYLGNDTCRYGTYAWSVHQVGAAGGTLMLLFYFLAYPPIPGYMFGVPVEGSYLWVNRTLLNFLSLQSLFFLHRIHFGLDRLIADGGMKKPVNR